MPDKPLKVIIFIIGIAANVVIWSTVIAITTTILLE
jgi:hypothetical protein